MAHLYRTLTPRNHTLLKQGTHYEPNQGLGHSSSMESQDQYRYPRRPDYEPRLWAQFDNTNFPRQENPQIKGTPANKQMANIETTTGIRPTYRSQPIRNESGQKKKKRQAEQKRKKFNTYV